jgi:hypothetical protein
MTSVVPLSLMEDQRVERAKAQFHLGLVLASVVGLVFLWIGYHQAVNLSVDAPNKMRDPDHEYFTYRFQAMCPGNSALEKNITALIPSWPIIADDGGRFSRGGCQYNFYRFASLDTCERNHFEDWTITWIVFSAVYAFMVVGGICSKAMGCRECADRDITFRGACSSGDGTMIQYLLCWHRRGFRRLSFCACFWWFIVMTTWCLYWLTPAAIERCWPLDLWRDADCEGGLGRDWPLDYLVRTGAPLILSTRQLQRWATDVVLKQCNNLVWADAKPYPVLLLTLTASRKVQCVTDAMIFRTHVYFAIVSAAYFAVVLVYTGRRCHIARAIGKERLRRKREAEAIAKRCAPRLDLKVLQVGDKGSGKKLKSRRLAILLQGFNRHFPSGDDHCVVMARVYSSQAVFAIDPFLYIQQFLLPAAPRPPAPEVHALAMSLDVLIAQQASQPRLLLDDAQVDFHEDADDADLYMDMA